MISLFKRKKARAVRIRFHSYESARKPVGLSDPIIGGDRYEVFGSDGRPVLTILCHDDDSGVLELEIVTQCFLISPSQHLREQLDLHEPIIRSKASVG
jgi:hypothetical protein